MRMLSPASLFLAATAVALAGCGEEATLPVAAGTGPQPQLPAPNATLIPTVNVAPAKGWPDGGMPAVAPGLQVAAFADGLDHPRWLHILPNGDVLVAESNAPPKEGETFSIKGWVQDLLMSRAGAKTPSANRITLLRDTNGDGVADTKSVFLENLFSPFGMELVGNDLYVANADAIVKFPYEPGQTKITAPGTKVTDLPGGPLNHHWTKNIIASKDGSGATFCGASEISVLPVLYGKRTMPSAFAT